MTYAKLMFAVLTAFSLAFAVTTYVRGEVNIAEVEGKYQEPDQAALIEWAKTQATKHALTGLDMAYQAGYLQAQIDFDIISSSEPIKGQ